MKIDHFSRLEETSLYEIWSTSEILTEKNKKT